MMQIITPHGSCQTQVLPDSGADISAAGEHILSRLKEHRDNLLPSEFSPHAANGQQMKSTGKMCVQFRIAGKEHNEDVYIFSNMRGVIISWKVARALSILPSHYPQPLLHQASLEPCINATSATQASPQPHKCRHPSLT